MTHTDERPELEELTAAERIRRLGPTIRPDELADVLRVTPQCVRRQCVAGTLKATRFGRLWLIDREEALRVLAKGAC